jgi:hypothetical protein
MNGAALRALLGGVRHGTAGPEAAAACPDDVLTRFTVEDSGAGRVDHDRMLRQGLSERAPSVGRDSLADCGHPGASREPGARLFVTGTPAALTPPHAQLSDALFRGLPVAGGAFSQGLRCQPFRGRRPPGHAEQLVNGLAVVRAASGFDAAAIARAINHLE